MAVAQETLDRLRTAGLEEIDPDIARLIGRSSSASADRSS